MITLAIETSTEIGSVCLYDSSMGILAEVRLGKIKRHSATLLPSISYLFKNSGLSLEDIDFISLGIGPGSFTGLRVGLSTAKGLCYSTGKPLVALSSLEAFAYQFVQFSGLICPLFDARKKEVYAAVFSSNSKAIKRLTPDMVCPISKVLSSIEDRTAFAGSGAIKYREQIVEALGDRAVFAPDSLMSPLASTVAVLAIPLAERGEFSDPVSLTPRYIRPSEAEIKLG
ncbi:MAG: tRNA (adenosine(37)-N6)-threonylcarbamoyltransferase complex dimerization subunit type 1 TsaB [Nitrospirae bacterium]|nr:tRNA (adenosine(37)-N6)-threonylcarbamoyltransferase complex dimerization subunit type 1 TsaB [Nitrospirota bacterium]